MIKDHTLIMLESLGISQKTLGHLLFTHWSILLKSWWLVLYKYQMSWVKILEAHKGIESSQSSQGWKTLKTKVKEMKSWQNNQSWNKTGSKKSNSTQGSTLQINWTQSVKEHSPKMFWGISCWDEQFPPALLLVSRCSWTPTWTHWDWLNLSVTVAMSCPPWSEPHHRFHPVGLSTQQLPADDTRGLLYYVSRFYRFVKSGMLHDACVSTVWAEEPFCRM